MCSQVRIWLAPTHRQNNTPDVRPLLDGAHWWSMFMRHAALPCLIALLVGVIAWRPVALASAPLPYPEGYRDWVHIGSTVIGPAHKRFATVSGIPWWSSKAEELEYVGTNKPWS